MNMNRTWNRMEWKWKWNKRKGREGQMLRLAQTCHSRSSYSISTIIIVKQMEWGEGNNQSNKIILKSIEQIRKQTQKGTKQEEKERKTKEKRNRTHIANKLFLFCSSSTNSLPWSWFVFTMIHLLCAILFLLFLFLCCGKGISTKINEERGRKGRKRRRQKHKACFVASSFFLSRNITIYSIEKR